jgi:hypothetical protein
MGQRVKHEIVRSRVYEIIFIVTVIIESREVPRCGEVGSKNGCVRGRRMGRC